MQYFIYYNILTLTTREKKVRNAIRILFYLVKKSLEKRFLDAIFNNLRK